MLKNVLPVNVNNSMIITDSMSSGGEVLLMPQQMVNARTFRTAPKAVGKNTESMSSKIHNYSTMQNIRMEYELYKELHRFKETEAAVL